MSLENKSFLCGQRPKVYKIYKCGLALFLVSMLIYGYVYQKQNPKRGQEDYWYTDYYSNWTEMTCTAWAVIHAYISINEKPSKLTTSSAVILSSLAFGNAFVLVFAYWGQMPPDQLTIDVLSLHQHTFLAVITFVDTLITPISYRWYHIFGYYVYGACYTTNALIAYALGRGCIYPFLDYDNHFYDALKLNFMLTVPVGSIAFLISYTLCRDRKSVV